MTVNDFVPIPAMRIADPSGELVVGLNDECSVIHMRWGSSFIVMDRKDAQFLHEWLSKALGKPVEDTK